MMFSIKKKKQTVHCFAIGEIQNTHERVSSIFEHDEGQMN